MEMTDRSVDLGFLEYSESWKLRSCFFPSKVGGKPAWLDLQNLPTTEELKCSKCQNQMIFLCQIYAPCDENDENSSQNFHRTIFVFICRNGSCCERNCSDNIKVFCSSLSKLNSFYPETPPKIEQQYNIPLDKFVNLCNVCGVLSDKKCSKCGHMFYCSRPHQVFDWNAGHKEECRNSHADRVSNLLFPESEIIIEPEELEVEIIDEKEELKKFKNLQNLGQTGTMSDVPESELDCHATGEIDKAFQKFKKRIDEYPDQIIRYNRGGVPLWIANEPIPTTIPNCQYCGSERQFEFQIMPQLLTLLKENELDWGVIAVYTCSSNCDKKNYREEFVFKQDVELNSI